jgi:quercetin dioxygenase-like cupin family protein
MHSPTAAAEGRLVVLASAAHTGGEYVEVEALLPAGAPASPERLLAGHEVRIEVLEGRLDLVVDGVARPLRAGEAQIVAPGTPHRLSVAEGTGPARFLWRVRPAPADEGLLESVFGLAPKS